MFDIALLVDLQSTLKPVDAIIRWISLHMYARHYLGISAIIYWAGYQVLAARLSCAVIFSTLIFGACRHVFPSVRPYWVSPELYNGIVEKAYGMPSGHTQNAVVFWGVLAFSLRHIFVILLALFMIGAIAISRMYLGLHFPIQIVWGLILGSSVLLLSILLENKFLRWLGHFEKGQKICLVAIFAIIPLIITVILREYFAIGSGNSSIYPYTTLILFTGLAVGVSTGWVITDKTNSVSSVSSRITRVLFGVITMYLLWIIFERVTSSFESKSYLYIFSFMRGLILAWWAIWFWPYIHKYLSLLKKESKTI